MLKKILFFASLFIPTIQNAHAEYKTYYNWRWQETQKDSANYYRIVEKEHGLYKVDDYYMTGQLYRTGYRTSMKSESAQYRTGHYAFFDSAGYKTREWDYDDEGHKTGAAKFYHRHSDKLKMESHYVDGAVTGHSLTYDTSGNVIADDEHISPQSTRTAKYVNGDTLVTINRQIGTDREELIFYKNSKVVKKRNIFRVGKEMATECYNGFGAKTECYLVDTPDVANASKPGGKIFQFVEQMPAAGYSVSEYLSNNLKYPMLAKKNNIQGRVIIKFVVEEDGAIADVQIIRGVGGGCDEEALRVVSAMPAWDPGRQNGAPVKVYFTLPILFQLTDPRR